MSYCASETFDPGIGLPDEAAADHVRMQRVDEYRGPPQRNAAVDHPPAQFRQHVLRIAIPTARRR